MTSISDRSLEHLLREARITGPVVLPGDDGWEAARQAWNLAVEQRPLAVVFPTDREDVQAAVRVAADLGVGVVTQGTGHSAACYDTLDDAILIRTTRLNDIAIEGRRCRVAAGALWGEVAMAAGEHGLAGLSGSSPDVGVVGYTLGGGIGWLSRPYGLASNSVRSIGLVTADGSYRVVDHQSAPDLFWALRGGGGGLGVVTDIEFDLYELPTVVAGTLAWDVTHAPALLAEWAEWAEGMDDSITSIIRYLNLPDIEPVPPPFRGRRVMTLGLAGVGDPFRVNEQVGVMRRVAPPFLDTVDTVPTPTLTRLHGDPESPVPGMTHHALLGAVDSGMIEAIDNVAGANSGSPLMAVEIRQLGGALARVPEGAGALSHIEAPYVMHAVGMVPGPGAEVEVYTALTHVVSALRPWTAGTYLNFVERPSGSPFDQGTTTRLAGIKAEFDPAGMFKARHGMRTQTS